MNEKRTTSALRPLAALILVGSLFIACGDEPSESAAEPTAENAPEGANDTTLEAEQELTSMLKNAAIAQESYFTTNTMYATTVPALQTEGLLMEDGVTLTIKSATADGYCMEATHASIDATYMYERSMATPAKGTC
jgi:hypothetical protein